MKGNGRKTMTDSVVIEERKSGIWIAYLGSGSQEVLVVGNTLAQVVRDLKGIRKIAGLHISLKV